MKNEALRMPILANAAFSLAAGVATIAPAPIVAQALGPEIEWIYRPLGAGLVLFSLVLGLIALRPSPLLVLGVTIADVAWIISAAMAALVWSHTFTASGLILIAATNLVVGAAALLQLRSIRTAFAAPGGACGEFEVCIAARAPADAEAFWTVLADLGAIKRYSPSLKASALTAGGRPGPGCVRTCENTKGQVWSERCDEWEEGSAFSVTFLADEPGFPYPFSRMHGGWRVEPMPPGCRVEVWWRVVPRHKWAAPILLPLMAAGAQKSFGDVIARMALAAKGVEPEGLPPSRLPQLRAAAC